MSDTGTSKIIWAIMGFLFLISGFLAGHWFNRMEDSVSASKNYTDSAVAENMEKMKPYLESLAEVRQTVAETNEQVTRMTSFMEYKYGMPEKKKKH